MATSTDAFGAIASQFVTTSDGVSLHYKDIGTGPTLFFIPGLCQVIDTYHHQATSLCKNYRCILLEMRGHGKSQKVDFGYSIQRLAKDVHDVVNALNLTDVCILGHSMGCHILWCYLDLFGPFRVGRVVLVDMSPFLLVNPNWPKDSEEFITSGAFYDFKVLFDLITAISEPNGIEATQSWISGLCSATTTVEEKKHILHHTALTHPQAVGSLLFNCCTQDWRHVIPRFRIPTLLVGAIDSPLVMKNLEWMHKQIPESELVVFEKGEGGHWMFYEEVGYKKFNSVVGEFLERKSK